MKIRNVVQLVGLITLTTGFWTSAARAANGDDRAHKFQLGTGIGFTASPKGMNLNIEGNYYVTNNISLAPQFNFTDIDHVNMYILSAEARYTMDVKGTQIENSIKPWVGAGAGMVICDFTPTGAGSRKGAEFQASGGLDFYFSKQFSLGSNMSVMVPFGIRDHFIYRWQVLEAKVLF